MVLIPGGSDGETRPDLLIKKPRAMADCEDCRKSKWDMPRTIGESLCLRKVVSIS
jgi:hypothetical protein